MKEKISPKVLFVTFFMVMTIIFVVFFYFLLPVQNNVEEMVQIKNKSSFTTLRLKIPKINISGEVVPLGLDSRGAMDVPTKPQEVGWLELSTYPGDIGTAVFDGHSGYKDNIPAIFDDLYKLRKGDIVSTEDKYGQVVSFTVHAMREYEPNEIVPEIFSSNDNKAHLNLITCSGVWNSNNKTHSKRLVVFTDRE